MRWLLLCLFVLADPPMATAREFIQVRSADGAKSMQVAVLEIQREEGILRIEREGGGVMTVRFDAFLPEDGVRMEEYYQTHVDPVYVTRAGEKAKRPKDPALEAQITKALDWLKSKRKPAGSLGEKFPVSMTAFALLAYSKNNEGVGSARYGKAVRGAIEYLVGVGEKGNGLMSSVRDRNLSYEHGIATWALAEALAADRRLGGDDLIFVRVERLLGKAVAIIVKGQTNGGGWLYSYGSNGTGDLSVSIWNLYALESVDAVLPLEGRREVMKRARDYLDLAAMKEGGYRYRVRPSDKGKWSLTGHGLLGHQIIGAKPPHEERALALLFSEPWDVEKPQLYSLLPQSDVLARRGGREFERFRKERLVPLRGEQRPEGFWNEGSRHHSAQLGPDLQLYATCLATLILQVAR